MRGCVCQILFLLLELQKKNIVLLHSCNAVNGAIVILNLQMGKLRCKKIIHFVLEAGGKYCLALYVYMWNKHMVSHFLVHVLGSFDFCADDLTPYPLCGLFYCFFRLPQPSYAPWQVP